MPVQYLHLRKMALNAAFVLVGLTPLGCLGQEDSAILWQSATSGKPQRLQYAPQGAQCHMVIRPAEIWKNAEAQRTVRALGPEFGGWLKEWAAVRALALPALDRLQFSIVRNSTGALETVAVVAPVSENHLPGDWAKRAENARTESADGTYYDLQRSGQTAWVPRRSGASVAVMGAAETVSEIAKRSEVDPILRREMEQLRRQSDVDRMLWILVSPQFLRSNIGVFHSATEGAMKFVEDLWNEEAQAIALSAHLVSNDELFAELKLVGTYESQRTLPNRIQSAVGKYVNLASSDVGRSELGALGARWARMVEFAGEQIRVANDGDVTIANVTLPAAAAHNLALGSSLLLQHPAAAERSFALAELPADSPRSTAAGLDPAALLAALKTRIDFKFDQQSLEFALRDLQSLVRDTVKGAATFEVQIDGPALRAAGITRNQQIANFSVQQKTVAEVLTQLVGRADPTLNSAEPGTSPTPGTLVWAAGPRLQDNGNGQVVLITTINIARQRRYQIPKDFRK